MVNADELRPALEDVLRPLLGGGVTVANLRVLTGGASRTTWAFDAVTDQRRGLILRTGPPEHALMELEAVVCGQLLCRTGQSVPDL